MEKLLTILLVLLQFNQGLTEWSQWGRYSDCSVTCGVGIRTRSRYCGDVPCQGSTEEQEKCSKLACPSEGKCNCGCKMTEDQGYLDSSLPIDESGVCIWAIETRANTKIKLTIQDVRLNQGSLLVSGPNRITSKSIKLPKTSKDQIPFTITSDSNRMNLSIYYASSPMNDKLVMQGNYQIVKVSPPVVVPSKEEKSNINAAAILGITACVIVIIVASIIIGYRKFFRQNGEKNEEVSEEGQEDNYSSASSSNRSSRTKAISPRSKNRPTITQLQQRELSPSRKTDAENGQQQRLLTAQYPGSQRGFPDGTEVFIPTNANMMVAGQASFIPQQQYVNWPVRQQFTEVDYRQAQPMEYMVKQAQLAYTPQVMYEQPRVQTFHYPTSGGEG